MPEMVSLTSHPYAGRDLTKGETFFCEPEHVNLLKVLGRARDKTEDELSEDEDDKGEPSENNSTQEEKSTTGSPQPNAGAASNRKRTETRRSK